MQSNTAPKSEFKVRRRYTKKQDRLNHVDAWKQSGLSIREYSRQHSISSYNLGRWKQAVIGKNSGFKQIKISPKSPVSLEAINVVELIVGQQLKIRLQNVEPSLIINIAKGLMVCN